MKVLIVHPRFTVYGGAELVIVELIKYLQSQKVKVGLLTTSSDVDPLIQGFVWGLKAPIKTIVCPNRLGGIKGEIVALANGVRKHAKDYDVINIHNFPATFSIPFTGKKPVVWMCNEPELYLYAKEKQYLVPFAAMEEGIIRGGVKKVVVADRYNRARLTGGFSIDPDKIEILPYGVDYNFWSQGKRVPHEGGLRLLQVGQVSPFKNQMASLKVVDRLVNSYTPIVSERIKVEQLFLVGSVADQKYKRRLEEFCNRRNLWPYVTMVRHIDREALREHYYRADYLLHPVKPQGGWLTPFDAICTGLPVIVSSRFTGYETIELNNLGYVVNKTSQAVNLIRAGVGAPSMAGEWVRWNLTWERYCSGMLKVFEEVV